MSAQHLSNTLLMKIFGMLEEPRVVALLPESESQRDEALAAVRRASRMAAHLLQLEREATAINFS